MQTFVDDQTIDKEKKKDEKSVYFYFSQITRLMHFMDG